jgi:hypothetical protein
MIASFERSIINSLWKQSLQQWDFSNDESHKDESRTVAEYTQHVLDENIKDTYQNKDQLLHPLNPLQEQQFITPIEELLQMFYSIRKTRLRSSSIYYIQRAETYNDRSTSHSETPSRRPNGTTRRKPPFPAKPNGTPKYTPPPFRKTGLNSK